MDGNYLILGHASHGKDEFAMYLAEALGQPHINASRIIAEKVVMPALTRAGLNPYADAQECFLDRGGVRAQWKSMIDEYTLLDPTRIIRLVLEECTFYAGIRCPRQLHHALSQRLFVRVFWVDAFKRKSAESPRVMRVPLDHSTMHVIDNNGTKANLKVKAQAWAERLRREGKLQESYNVRRRVCLSGITSYGGRQVYF